MKNYKRLPSKCKCNLRHISMLGSFVDCICPIELEKDITDTDRSASYLDLHLDINNVVRKETLRQKR